MLSAVMLNWKRPDNVRRIVDDWRAHSLVRDAVVWNNNLASYGMDLPRFCNVIDARDDAGLYSRFAAASLAKQECVLVQDDDLILPKKSLEALVTAWENDPMVLHGIFGRKPKADGTYSVHLRGDLECPMVLTRALVMHRTMAARFFLFAENLHEVQRDSTPLGNGEDIILSYAAKAFSRKDNRIHKLDVRELPNQHAINKRTKGHHQHRTHVMHACQRLLNLELKLATEETRWRE